MSTLKYVKIISFSMAILLQTGALSAAESDDKNEGVFANPDQAALQSDSFTFNSGELRFADPIQLTTSYTELEHIFSKSFKNNVHAGILSTDHTHSAGVSWLAPTKAGSSLKLSLLGGYLDSQATDNNTYQMGIQATYAYDWDAPTHSNAGYAEFRALGVPDLKAWASDPTVRRPEVIAVVDEAIFKAIPMVLSSSLSYPSIELTAFNKDISSNFKNSDSLLLTFTSNEPYSWLTVNSNGRIIADSLPAYNPAGSNEYSFQITVTNQWGFSVVEDVSISVREELPRAYRHLV